MTSFIERTPASRATYFKASFVYLAFMTAWLYGFANSQQSVPQIVILLGLISAILVHFFLGLAIPRNEAFALLSFPPLLALVGPGVNSLLWVPLVLIMVFPCAPLVLLGLFLRRRAEPQQVEDYWF